MQYGAMNFPIQPVHDELEAIAALGFDYMELTMDPPQAHYTIIRQHKYEIRKALDEHSMGCICHLPTLSITINWRKEEIQ